MLKVSSKESFKVGTGLVSKFLKQRPVFCPPECFQMMLQMMLQADQRVLQHWPVLSGITVDFFAVSHDFMPIPL